MTVVERSRPRAIPATWGANPVAVGGDVVLDGDASFGPGHQRGVDGLRQALLGTPLGFQNRSNHSLLIVARDPLRAAASPLGWRQSRVYKVVVLPYPSRRRRSCVRNDVLDQIRALNTMRGGVARRSVSVRQPHQHPVP